MLRLGEFGSSWEGGGSCEEGGACFSLNPCSWTVSRGQWSEEETDEEEDEVSPESHPKKDDKAEGGLQINVEDEQAFVLPPAGETEQDIL